MTERGLKGHRSGPEIGHLLAKRGQFAGDVGEMINGIGEPPYRTSSDLQKVL